MITPRGVTAGVDLDQLSQRAPDQADAAVRRQSVGVRAVSATR